MRTITTAFCLLFAMASALCAQAQDRPRTKIVLLDRIVAVVGKEYILESDLNAQTEFDRQTRMLAQNATSQATVDKWRAQRDEAVPARG